MSTTPSTSTQPSTMEDKPPTPPAVKIIDTPKPPLPSWSQAEVASSQSAQRIIPPGEETKVFSWADIKEIISTNRLGVIRRQPSTHVVYKACDPTPFADPKDFRILPNDWPYGSFGPGITHLIVWSKPRIATDPETGFVTPESKELIDAFVDRTFVKRLELEGDADAGERVLWFKNWGALQSVRGLEHIHVLVKDVLEAIIEEWTGEMKA
ncbi:MAG: hypothetical protein Q9226_006780 [Calogaya cf. arnoldii]